MIISLQHKINHDDAAAHAARLDPGGSFPELFPYGSLLLLERMTHE